MRSRRTCLLAVAALFAALLAAVASPAVAAASPWSLVTPSVPTAPNGAFQAVSCAPDASICTAVGSYRDPNGQQRPLIAQRTRTVWRQTPVSAPAGAVTLELDGVSCTGATSCTAVGRYSPTGNGGGFEPTDDRPLAYVWDGTTWARTDLALPADSPTGRLTAVSCTTAASCMAVGDRDRNDGARTSLAYRFDGTRWTNVAVPVVSDLSIIYEGLQSVSCPAVRTCVAVGDGPDPAGTILGWNGSVWRKQAPAPAPADAGIGELSGVSCPSTTVCTAVGYYYDFDSGKDIPQAERLEAGHWTRDTPPAVPDLRRVSCPTTTACFAATFRIVKGDQVPAVARRTPSGTWGVTTLPEPDPAADYGFVDGISCPSVTACTAVGTGGGVPFVERYTGTWAVEPTVAPLGVFGSRLAGVACSDVSACTAVGSYTTANQALALIQRWDGTTWTRQPVPSRAGAVRSDLADVACPTASACFAVGADGDDPDGVSTPRPLLLAWNGTAWTTVHTPGPATDGALTGISCRSATSCVAVGYQYGSGAGLAYVLQGSTWTARPVPPPTGVGGISLTGVSCAATTCHAVGSGYTDGGDVVHVDEVWNGTRWTAGATVGAVDAVSCTAPTVCTGVGTADYGAEDVVVQTLRNGAWTGQSVPNPGGTAYLTGVSCVGATCTAVGTAEKALVERSVGGRPWAIESAVTPPGTGGLHDVACVDVDRCVAVGTFGNRGYIEVRSAG